MPDAKHTPGPWVAARGRMGMLIQTKVGHLPVAEVGAISITSECEANANLIAAVTELAEACRMFVEAAHAQFGGTQTGEMRKEDLAEIYEAATSALAKATGTAEGERGSDDQ